MFILELLQDGSSLCPQQVQGRTDDPVLELRVVGSAQGKAESVGDEQRSWRFDPLSVLLHGGDGRGDQTRTFENPGQHAHGVGAAGSNRGHQYDVRALGLEALRDLWPGLVNHAVGVEHRPHE